MRVGLCIAGLGALGIVVVAAGMPAPARAQTDDERARTHFESGRSYYEQAQYEDAAREFQESFDLSARPELLLNISQAQERALHYDDAIGAARHYLELLPTADNKKTVEERIASLTELKQRFEEGGPAPLAPPGDSSTLTPMGDSPTGGATTPATPGAATTPKPTPPTAAVVTTPGPDLTQTPESERENKYTIPAIILMGAGGAALVGALVTGVIAHADYNSLERQCRGKICPASARDELDEGKTLSVVSTVLTVVGVLAAGAGGALLFVGTREAEETPPAAGHVSLGPGVTPLSVSGTISF